MNLPNTLLDILRVPNCTLGSWDVLELHYIAQQRTGDVVTVQMVRDALATLAGQGEARETDGDWEAVPVRAKVVKQGQLFG